MLRSLNFWLFLVVIICGISLFITTGVSVPFSWDNAEKLPSPATEWSNTATDQPAHLRILNGTDHGGLAREFSLLISGRGCVVEGIGNASGTRAESLLVNRRMGAKEAKILAGKLGGIAIIRQWDERMTEDAVLVLGEDFKQVRAALLE